MSACPKCGREVVQTDYEGEDYHSEDTEWGVHPMDDDGVGFLVSKSNAIPCRMGCFKEKE